MAASDAAVAVKTEGLGKRYRIRQQGLGYGRLTESVTDLFAAPIRRLRGERQHPSSSPYFWALKDVNLSVGHGEVVGIIGRNGAGKTTLLKILSRITKPTEGYAELNGRVGSLLEVGSGFHPELTGRENVFLNGAVLGMRRAEIQRKFDEIVGFAEVEKFLDTPVKRYSSGMYVRLAFAVAAHMETEILIVDEVLAVGDAAFQRKCLGKMDEVASQGRTILFVSHNMAAVENLCTTGYLLEGGSVVAGGPVREITGEYLKRVTDSSPVALHERLDRQGDGRLVFQTLDADMVCGAPGVLSLGYRGKAPLRNVHVSIGIFTLRGEGVAYLSNDLTGIELDDLPPTGNLVCRMDKVPLLPGTYTMNVYCTVNGVLADWIIDAARLDVFEGDYFGSGKLPPGGYGSTLIAHQWDITHA